MDRNHAAWNARQHQLQEALLQPEAHPEWLSLFFTQHAQVHSSVMSGITGWSFEDDALSGMDETALRAVPPKCEHSVAWILWHLARCEDLTMSMLAGGEEQVLTSQGWLQKLHTPIHHTGNAISLEEIIRFSQAVDLDNLKAYRRAVGQNTRLVVQRLNPSILKQQVDPERMGNVRSLNAVLDPGVLNYWSHRTIAGLLLMPPTRHCFTHLNEILRIRPALHMHKV